MTNNEARILVEKLMFAFSNSNVSKDSNVAKFYLDFLVKLDGNIAENVIDGMVQSFDKLPPVSEIKRIYNRELRRINELQEAEAIFNECEICEGKGWILDRRVKETQQYSYTLHCTCDKGNQYTNCMSSIKTKYSIEDIVSRRRRQKKTPKAKETIEMIKTQVLKGINTPTRKEHLKAIGGS